jgi:hypothetical protein
MTARESLHLLVEGLPGDGVGALAAIARDRVRGASGRPDITSHAESVIDARVYPVLAAIWDNAEGAIFDTL